MRIGAVASCQKLGIILENNVILKLILSKNVNNTKFAPKFFFNEKNQKNSNDFGHTKLTLKVRFWHFLTPPHYTDSQNSLISFGYFDFRQKSFQFCKLDNLYYHGKFSGNHTQKYIIKKKKIVQADGIVVA